VSAIRLQRLVPLEVPDAEVCDDGVCEIPGAAPADAGTPASEAESPR
jgi:hypothetical protein